MAAGSHSAGERGRAPIARQHLRTSGEVFLCVGVASGIAVWLGQDANWDLRNYHFYNAQALVEGRGAIDVAPAQMQSFHSPYADLPFHAMTRAGWPTWLIAAVLALPGAVALFLSHRLAVRLMPGDTPAWVAWFAVAVFATGSAGAPVLGTTMSEWHLVALLLGALLLVLPRGESDSDLAVQLDWRAVLLAGWLAGLASGLKLTAVPAFAGLTVVVGLRAQGFRDGTRLIAGLGLGGAIGFAMAYGAWGWALWNRFGNPVFPYFNDIFASPWAEPLRFADDKFAARSVFEFLALPFRLMAKNAWLVSEAALRDWRMALGGAALAWLVLRSPVQESRRRLWQPLAGFVLAYYAVWAVGSGIYRYVGILEAVMAVALVAAVWQAFPAKRTTSFAMLAIVLAASTKWPGWERAPHGTPLVNVAFPALPERSMVVLATMQPIGYAVAALPANVPAVSLVNNLLRDSARPARLHREGIARAQRHAGPLWLLRRTSQRNEKSADGRPVTDLLASWGFVADDTSCRPVLANWREDDLELCGLVKAKALAEPAANFHSRVNISDHHIPL